MREILFRGKRLDNGEWVQGDLLQWANSTQIITKYCDNYARRYEYVNPETVGEFTELTDKNGTKIFEGDIVKVTDKYNHSVVYVLDYKYAAFMLKQKGVDYSIHFTDILPRFYSIEVIGNIHDNPELIGGADNG